MAIVVGTVVDVVVAIVAGTVVDVIVAIVVGTVVDVIVAIVVGTLVDVVVITVVGIASISLTTTLSIPKLSSFASPSRLFHTRTVNGTVSPEVAFKVALQPVTGNDCSLKCPPHTCAPSVASMPFLTQHVSPFTDTYAVSLSLHVR